MPRQSDTVDPLLAALKELTLWQHFDSVASPEQQTTVKKLLDHADALLSRVVETFPTYTLHDRTHAINVAKLMGKLAEPWIQKMNALEAGLLLLSAFWHDVGMVFTEEERETIAETEEFRTFLRSYPEAQLEVARDREVSPAVTEWFCRWSHAERVFHHLNRVEDRLEWDGIPLRPQLGNLCRSHNLDAAELKNDELCPTKYQGLADVRYCAVLLRLADILDFDRTRSPETIYHYLGISRRATSREKVSDVEWRKHLDSNGFLFPEREDGRVPYSVTFVASPNEPAVEWDVRQFLDIIEGEILSCQQLMHACSPKWRETVLPVRIEREVYSKNYKFGDYRFVLDQEQVLGLLMGENLYKNPYVFVRELLQNALDTSRHREFHERAQGKVDFRCEPIVVSDWYDDEQYYWVRFDDYGMGMTEDIIRNFLLKVGRSYYASPEFKAEQLQYTAQKGFTPISRFGIGLLSCFIAGDRVEILTRHTTATSRTASIRLSLSGLHGFFTLQTGNHIPSAMPSAAGDEPDYRSVPGTSVAVRLNPKKEKGHLDLGTTLETFLLYPPVPVRFQDREIGGNPTLLSSPWLEQRLTLTLDEAVTNAFFTKIVADTSTRISLCMVPVDLTSHAPVDKLTGQLIVITLSVQSDTDKLEEDAGISREYDLSISHDEIQITATVHVDKRDFVTPVQRELRAKIEEIPIFSRMASWSVRNVWTMLPAEIQGKMLPDYSIFLTHNGIAFKMSRLPENRRFLSRTVGTIALSDELRPELSISREELRRLPWNVCSAIELANRRGIREAGLFPTEDEYEDLVPWVSDVLLSEVLDDKLMSNVGDWMSEPIIHIRTGESFEWVSANFLRERLASGAEEIWVEHSPSYYYGNNREVCEIVSQVLLQRDFLLVLHKRGKHPMFKVVGIRTDPVSVCERYFPPLTFVSFADSHALYTFRYINADHAFTNWLLSSASCLADHFPGFLQSIREYLLHVSVPSTTLVNEINGILDRLRAIDPVLAPQSLRLVEEDISW